MLRLILVMQARPHSVRLYMWLDDCLVSNMLNTLQDIQSNQSQSKLELVLSAKRCLKYSLKPCTLHVLYRLAITWGHNYKTL